MTERSLPSASGTATGSERDGRFAGPAGVSSPVNEGRWI